MHWGSGMEPIEPAMKIGRLTTKKKQFRCCMGGPSQGSLPAPFQPRKPSANPLFEKNSHRRRPEKERLPKEVLLGGFAVKGIQDSVKTNDANERRGERPVPPASPLTFASTCFIPGLVSLGVGEVCM
ncbi:hypothetical protein TWF594_000054 [Orbilia oligospora]|uniref:Uncharacterized protein n=1 Tax=Orbilia oligospora TaxID=2813651 RepID=A0A7C8P3Q6_ORBOL|nr:hypothetical protein TWF703_009953 [Orbilia oligospora]KAF3153007.1 hypothetical protein TWF594_000054 [Orbilia oligospora]